MIVFQSRVRLWMFETFGYKIADDKQERNFRFFEEAVELVQSLDMTKEECLELIEYVYGRAKGEPGQELGGTLVTLAALAGANKLSMDEEGYKELERILVPEVMQKIRDKQKTKPAIGSKPGVYPERVPLGVKHG